MLKILELFGGIGACSKALEKLNIDYEIVDYVEIDKYAVASFNAIHNTNFEPQDVCNWDKDIEVDLIMHGSPCQDFSLAGKQAGGDKDSGTRSSLMYETLRIVNKLKPKYVIWENVKNLLSKKHKHNFDEYIAEMSGGGYTSYYQVLNAKNYGIPQNRERVFTISIRNDIKKDFKFPPAQELKLKLKDMLEENVDEKYYLSDKMINYISATGTENFKNNDSKINLEIARPITTDQNKRAGTTNYLSEDLPENYDLNGKAYLRNFGSKGKLQKEDYCDTLTASMGTGGGNTPIVIRKYGVFDNETQKHQAGSVYDKNGLAPTLDTMQGGYRQPCIEVNNIIQVGQLDLTDKEPNPQDGRIYDYTGLTPTIDTKHTPKILIKNATKKGYLEAFDGDGVDISGRMQYHRGNVQKNMSQTITTQGGDNVGVVLYE